MLNKGLNELLAKTSQAMAVLAGEAMALTVCRQLLSTHRQEVEVWREGAKKVQNVVSAVVSDDAFTFDGRAQLHGLLFPVEHFVALNLDLTHRAFLFIKQNINFVFGLRVNAVLRYRPSAAGWSYPAAPGICCEKRPSFQSQ